MFALPKWITDIKKLFGAADGKVLGREDGEWVFQATVPPSAHADSHATEGSDPITLESIGAASTENEHTHTNKTAIDKIGELNGEPTWNGSIWPGGGGSGASCPDYILQNMGII